MRVGIDATSWANRRGYGRFARNVIRRLVELDPDTLSPRTSKTFVAPAPDSWLRPQLVCGDLCRVVIADLGGDIFTWAPGERSATRMRLGTRRLPATLLDASFRSGNLVVASAKTLRLRRPPWSVEQITIVRGDARGSRARRVASVAPAPYGPTSPFQWQPSTRPSFPTASSSSRSTTTSEQRTKRAYSPAFCLSVASSRVFCNRVARTLLAFAMEPSRFESGRRLQLSRAIQRRTMRRAPTSRLP